MKHVKIGVIVFIVGFILIGICGNILGNGSDSSIQFLILVSILYLSAIVGVATSLIMEKLSEREK